MLRAAMAMTYPVNRRRSAKSRELHYLRTNPKSGDKLPLNKFLELLGTANGVHLWSWMTMSGALAARLACKGLRDSATAWPWGPFGTQPAWRRGMYVPTSSRISRGVSASSRCTKSPRPWSQAPAIAPSLCTRSRTNERRPLASIHDLITHIDCQRNMRWGQGKTAIAAPWYACMSLIFWLG